MRKLNPRELEIGMITAEEVLTPLGQFLAPAGTAVTRQLINRMKLYKVESVLVEGEEPKETAPEPEIKKEVKNIPKTFAEKSKTHFQKVSASDAFRDFQFHYFAAIDNMKSVFEAAQKSETIDTSALLESVAELFKSRATIVELFDMLFNMRSIADPIYSHSLNVGLISRMIGRWLRMDRHDLNTLTMAGLLHDIGKSQIPEDILNKPGKYSDEEFALMKTHPKLGYDLLKDQPIDSHIKKAALMHHERSDGSGYPNGLQDDLIDEYAMIVGIADVYDAMTASRTYRSPMCPFEVIAMFEHDGYQKYNTKLLLTFLKHIAATYQSNRVVLNDGRACNIVLINQNSLSRPMVKMDDGTIIDLDVHRELQIKSVM